MSSSLQSWDEMNSTEDATLYIPTEEELLIEAEPKPEPPAQKVVAVEAKALSPAEVISVDKESPLSHEHELIAQAMLLDRGDLAKASRRDTIDHNAMSLRAEVKKFPAIRARYHELIAEELQESGLHIAERILRMAKLQEDAMGQTVMVEGLNGPEEMDLPADPKMVIELSKEISRLIAEGKQQDMSAKSTVILASKEDAKEILAKFLNS